MEGVQQCLIDMKITLDTGCMSYHVSFDKDCLMFMDDMSEIYNKTIYVIRNVRYENMDDLRQVLIDSIEDLVDSCENSSERDVFYGDDAFEKMIVHTLNTKSHRIHYFYDYNIGEDWIVADDKKLTNNSYVDIDFIREVLIDVFDYYISNPRYDIQEDIKLKINGVLGNIIEGSHNIEHVSEPCECCGDSIYTYMIEI